MLAWVHRGRPPESVAYLCQINNLKSGTVQADRSASLTKWVYHPCLFAPRIEGHPCHTHSRSLNFTCSRSRTNPPRKEISLHVAVAHSTWSTTTLGSFTCNISPSCVITMVNWAGVNLSCISAVRRMMCNNPGSLYCSVSYVIPQCVIISGEYLYMQILEYNLSQPPLSTDRSLIYQGLLSAQSSFALRSGYVDQPADASLLSRPKPPISPPSSSSSRSSMSILSSK